jgi:acid stress-induced BolA-like protein IbaG/YrbA
MHPVNFCTSWRLLGGFILVIADTFSGLGSIPRQETIYLSNFPEGTLNVHFSGFSFILIFFSQVVEGLCQVRDESLIFSSLYEHVFNICFNVAPKL